MTIPSHPAIERARKLACLLDSAFKIPIIGKKVGLDPLLGLLPVGGDVLAALISCYLIWVAYELGLPRRIMLRMALNIALDWALGMIPVVGDWTDMVWKSNRANFQILEAAYKKHGSNASSSTRAQRTNRNTVIDVQVEPA